MINIIASTINGSGPVSSESATNRIEKVPKADTTDLYFNSARINNKS